MESAALATLSLMAIGFLVMLRLFRLLQIPIRYS